MSNLYFIRVEGADQEMMESIAEQGKELETDDNIVVVPKEVEPLDREMAKEYLKKMADALDMTVEDK